VRVAFVERRRAYIQTLEAAALTVERLPEDSPHRPERTKTHDNIRRNVALTTLVLTSIWLLEVLATWRYFAGLLSLLFDEVKTGIPQERQLRAVLAAYPDLGREKRQAQAEDENAFEVLIRQRETDRGEASLLLRMRRTDPAVRACLSKEANHVLDNLERLDAIKRQFTGAEHNSAGAGSRDQPDERRDDLTSGSV
jgi:hypothetical protein